MPTIVTGGAGFIGSTLVDRLLDEGREVVAVDNFDPFCSPEPKAVRTWPAASDRHDSAWSSWTFAMARPSADSSLETRPTAIAHLAAKAGVRPSIDDPSSYVEVNVGGHDEFCWTRRFALPGPLRFVFASSSSVYGDRLTAPFRESDPVDSDQPLRGDQEGLRADGIDLPPPPRDPRDRPPPLHRVWAEEPPRPGHRQVRRPDRARRADPDVRRRQHPPATPPVRWGHRRTRHHPGRRPLRPVPAPLQPWPRLAP